MESGVVNIWCNTSILTSFSFSMSNNSINAITEYTLWFVTVNNLTSDSFVYVDFPSDATIQPNASCSSTGGSGQALNC